MKRILTSILFLLTIFLFQKCSIGTNTLEGKVVRILDGDTIELLVDKTPHRIRFYAIDTPEKNQAFGNNAREFTAEHSFQKDVKVIVRDKDRYGRIVGEVILPDGRNLNHELLKAGLAWWYRDYSDDPKLLEMELKAREQKIGLWKDKNPVAPWDFRKNQRNRRKNRKEKDKSFLEFSAGKDFACLNLSTKNEFVL